jgi:hypothetical protein
MCGSPRDERRILLSWLIFRVINPSRRFLCTNLSQLSGCERWRARGRWGGETKNFGPGCAIQAAFR